jgi:hypothetical protein
MPKIIDFLKDPVSREEPMLRHSIIDYVVDNKYDQEKGFQQIETDFLNPLGLIPLVGTITGLLRVLLGMVELLFSIIGNWFFYPGRNCSTREFDHFIAFGLVCFAEAICNLLRGIIEMIPGGGYGIKYFWDDAGYRFPAN